MCPRYIVSIIFAEEFNENRGYFIISLTHQMTTFKLIYSS